eukprot:TRINITY_DN43452_c0_g1_i1.p1 TRINITY_DN43452_c0_g1~~TRINITY_DN43452_c0_g1_i1.p1  ORF type:complete len:508 (-),score=48.49 TRINITY_DN43452_c0_g1_i1:105-1628(-)
MLSMRRLFSTATQLAASQRALVAMLLDDPRFRTPVIALWISDAGGSIHMPAIMFFTMRLGASPLDMGMFGFLMRSGSMLFSPLYGRWVDRHGIQVPLGVCLIACTIGCLIRAVATEVWHLYVGQFFMGIGGGSAWSMVKGFIARSTTAQQRPLLISGLKLQMLGLSLLKVLYPALDFVVQLLGVDDQLLRYRAVISTCMAFCAVSTIIIFLQSPSIAIESVECKGRADSSSELEQVSPEDEVATAMPTGSRVLCQVCSAKGFFARAVALAITSCVITICQSLWPLFLVSRFGWGASQYAYLSFCDTVVTSAALGIYPRFATARLYGGGSFVASALASFAACAVFIAYCVVSTCAGAPGHGWLSVIAHVVFALVGFGAIGVLGPCLETLASLALPRESQGLAMGALHTAFSAGSLCGYLVGMGLWSLSLQLGSDTGLLPSGLVRTALAGGGLPYAFVILLLLLVWMFFNWDTSEADDACADDDAHLKSSQELAQIVGATYQQGEPSGF